MNKLPEKKSCEEIIAVLNELIDGNIDTEKKQEAEELIKKNPECRALYNTLLKTIDLYKTRTKEIDRFTSPLIHWKGSK